MKKSKIAIVFTFILVLVGSNALWFFTWVDSSLNEKSLDQDIAFYKNRGDNYYKFIQALTANSSRVEIEQLINEHYQKDFWVSGDTINTSDFKFVFKSGKLVKVVPQTDINPNDKG